MSDVPSQDYKVPYGYSPVLAAHPSTLSSSPDMVKAFLAATAKGYAWAAAQPAEAAALLVSAVAKDTATKPLPTPLDGVMVAKSQAWVAPHCLTADGRCAATHVLLLPIARPCYPRAPVVSLSLDCRVFPERVQRARIVTSLSCSSHRSWGVMKTEQWESFVGWLEAQVLHHLNLCTVCCCVLITGGHDCHD